jgi:hypothetical protein
MYYTPRFAQGDHVEIAFVESPTFTRRVVGLGLEEELRELQEDLRRNPNSGSIDAGTGGMRKVRMRRPGQGKRGGARVHYLFVASVAVIYMAFVYGKDEQESLTPRQKQQLQVYAVEIKRELERRIGTNAK